jgi:hypothetical protein
MDSSHPFTSLLSNTSSGTTIGTGGANPRGGDDGTWITADEAGGERYAPYVDEAGGGGVGDPKLGVRGDEVMLLNCDIGAAAGEATP